MTRCPICFGEMIDDVCTSCGAVYVSKRVAYEITNHIGIVGAQHVIMVGEASSEVWKNGMPNHVPGLVAKEYSRSESDLVPIAYVDVEGAGKQTTVACKGKFIFPEVANRIFEGNTMSIIDFIGVNFDYVEYCDYMFFSCMHLKKLDLSEYKFTHLREMYALVGSSPDLRILDLSNFNPKTCRLKIGCLVYHCASIDTLLLQAFDITNLDIPLKGSNYSYLTEEARIRRINLSSNNIEDFETLVKLTYFISGSDGERSVSGPLLNLLREFGKRISLQEYKYWVKLYSESKPIHKLDILDRKDISDLEFLTETSSHYSLLAFIAEHVIYKRYRGDSPSIQLTGELAACMLLAIATKMNSSDNAAVIVTYRGELVNCIEKQFIDMIAKKDYI